MERGSHSDFLLLRSLGVITAVLLVAGTVIVPLNALAALPGACNCVILRLDDIQDWWLNSVQNEVMDEFIERDEKVSLGIVMNFVGNDPSVVDKVRAGHVSENFELVSHAWNHVDHQGLTLQQQQDTLDQANDKMQSLWGRGSYIFIPPYNSFNTDTLQALQNLDMKLISSEFDNLAPFVQPNQVFKSQTGSDITDSYGLYELPQSIGYWNYDDEIPVKNSLSLIMSDVTSRINSHGYVVVTLHPQDFAVKVNDVPTNQADPNEMADLNTLIDLIHDAGFTIKSYSEVTNIPLPPIVDNTAPVMTLPADKAVISSQPLTNVNLGTPTVTDNVDPTPTVTNNAPAEGFPQGTTAVTWNATDDSGNTRLATQYVTIRPTADNVKPSITTTAPPSGSISGPASGLNLPVTGTASDAQTGLKIIEARTGTTAYKTATQTNPGSWSNWSATLRFTSSTSTTIVARATDFWGNQQWYNTPITVTLSGPDTTAPELTVPADVFTEATSVETPVYIGMATAFDNSDPAPVITSDNPGSGEAAGFPVGTTVITWTATDAAGNSANATQTITVVDTTAPGIPELLLPANGSQAPSGTVNFDWNDVVDSISGVSYDMLVADNPEFSSPAIEETGLVQSNYTTLASLQAGTYYWKVRSADESGNQSPYSDSNTFTIDSSAPSAAASPLGGIYNTAQSVALTADEPATIYYTLDGSTPTTSSAVYSGPLDISADMTLKFFAVDIAGNPGVVVTETYDIDATAPTVNASPAGGVYNTAQSVTLTASELAAIYYTTDGSTPTTSSAVYADPVSITDTSDLKFFAVDTVGNTGLVSTESYIFDLTAPTVTATPGSGVYNTPQSVTLTASEPGSTIYYTTDGSTPTASSAVYSSPIEISVNTDLKFFAVDGIGNTGSVVTKTYSFDTIAPTVTASPPGGTYNTAQSVTLAADESATAYYTTDGSEPTTASAAYSTPIVISSTTDLKFFAVDVAGNTASTTTANYVIDTVIPTVTASPPGGLYNTLQSVVLSPDEAANVYFTTDGSEPTTSSTVYSGAISISSDTELKFFAVDIAGNTGVVMTEDYVIDTVPPTVNASPAGGVYNTAQSVTLTASEPATIYYTTDGSEPTTSSIVYSDPISISTDTALKFFAIDTAANTGAVVTRIYILDTTAPTVNAFPPGGTYSTQQTVTLTPSESSAIYYTLDGSTPTTSSAVYSGPLDISADMTLKFFAVDTAENQGQTVTETYVIDATAPVVTASPPGGTYNTPQSVALSSSEPATIYYTTDGTEPTTVSAVYSGPISVPADTDLKFLGVDGVGNEGAVATESYIIDTVPPTASAAPTGGTYGSAQSVALTASEPATIYYTTDGSEPTTASATYASPIPVTQTADVKFFAVDLVGNVGAAVTESYVIDITGPAVTASPPGGAYNTTQPVTLTADELGSTIYYTTDGSTPTTVSSVYSGPIEISVNTDLKFFAVDGIGNAGPVSTESYVIDTAAPTATASTAGGTYGSAQSVALSASEPATIYYTLDGSEPTTASAVYASALNIAADTTLKFFAVDIAGNPGLVVTETYSIDSLAPTVSASPPGGTYSSAQSVTLTPSEPATVYYTTDGSEPTTASTAYSSPIAISVDTELKFFGIDGFDNAGLVVTESYVIDTTGPAITASPAGGLYNSAQSVSLVASEPGSTIYYTTDGTTPTTSSAVYSDPIAIIVTSELKFFGIDNLSNAGPVATESYVIDTVPPTVAASPPGGTYSAPQSVTLAASELESTIYYTTDGSEPTTASSTYTVPISITSTADLKSFAVDQAGNQGPVTTESYVIDVTGPTVSASPPGGAYNTAQSVTLEASEPGSTIYYTTDGSEPTTASTIYSGPIAITETADLKSFAVDGLGNAGPATTQSYVIDTDAPTASASPAGGVYGAPQSVILAASEPGATIYLTTDGSTPTTASAVYSSALNISADTALKFFAVDLVGNSGAVLTETYTIDVTGPTVTASPAGGLYNIPQSVTLTASEPATIYYTTDGSDPTTSSTVYSGPISIAATTELKFFGADGQGNNGPVITESYVIDTAAPTATASPAGGLYTAAQSVTLTPSESATMYYTTDGTEPTTASAVYVSPIPISATTPLKFFAVDAAGNTGSTVTENYTIDTVAPSASAAPPGGTYASAQSIALSASEPATIYYTVDGSTPTTSSPAYLSPINIPETTTLKFFAVDTAGNAGTVVMELYTIESTTFPVTHMSDTTATFGLATHSGQQSHVEFASPTSQLVGKSIDQMTLKLRKTGNLSGQAQIGVFNADLTVKKEFGTIAANTIASTYTDYTFSLPNNELYAIQSGDRIGIKYTGGNSANFIAVMLDQDPADPFDGTNTYRQQYTTSWVSSTPNDLYMILRQTHGSVDTIPPTVTAFPAGGSYTVTQSVTLTADEPATIYYTLDGSEPTTSSAVYSAPLGISTTTTLKFFAVDAAGNVGAVTTEVYTIQPVSFPVTHMSDTTATFGLATNSATQSHVEFASPTSQLVGKSIDQMTLKLRKTGSPAGTLEVGVFNADLSVKKSFGTMTASAVASTYTDYTFSLTGGELYTIEAGDRIGIKYTGGDATNFVAVMIDRDSADPFDGTNTYRQQYTTSWSNYQADDLYMILRQTHA